MKSAGVLPVWENPEIQGINRLPMRSPLVPFGSPEEAILDVIAGPEFRPAGNSAFRMSLDGVWRFTLLNNPREDGLPDFSSSPPGLPGAIPPGWILPSYDPGGWKDIRVPGTWTLQGWDKPHYTNVQMPFEGEPPRPPEHNPTGLYRRNFSLPASWKGRRTVLHIGSAESCCLVYINGIFAGAGKDTRLPSEYDITPFLNGEGENTLCLKVVRYSDASYIEDQDQWWFGGIHRSVFLYSTEDCYIQDVKAVPGALVRDAEGARGILRLGVSLGGDLPPGRSTGNNAVREGAEGEIPFIIRYALYPFVRPSDAAGVKAAADSYNADVKPAAAGELSLNPNYRLNSNRVEAELTVRDPALWSHEAPNLYVVTVSLFKEGRHIESAAFCTAFRNIRIAKRELLINERAALIKGVNRHEHDEKNGKTLSTGGMLRDIMLLKEHNFNAVRTCHYPDDERWYDLCDRYGIYLIDEANVEHHCFYNQLCHETAWSYAYLSRIQRMAERDKNHPSVIIWSLGNESGDEANNRLCGSWLRSFDPSRPVHYEGAVRPPRGQGSYTLDSLCGGRDVTDIVSPMYPSLELLSGFAKYREDDRPLIMCEYSHAMGNSSGGLADYWRVIEDHHGLQGGFIWDWIDQGIEAFTPEGEKYWKYGGDFGDEPSDYDFCLNGILFPDQSPKPAMAECKQVFCPVKLVPLPSGPLNFRVENRFDFTPLDRVELDWRICGAFETLARGTLPLPALQPGEVRELAIPLQDPAVLQGQGGLIYFHADFRMTVDSPWSKAGRIIGSAERIIREALPLPPPVPAGMAASGHAGGAFIEEFAASFKPSLFRVPTENDGLKTCLHLRGDPAASFYYQNKAMYPWLDLDLLHLRCSNGKTETVRLEGYTARRYTACLLAGEGAGAEHRDRRLGTYTLTTVPPEEGRPLILDACFDLDPLLPELPRVGLSARFPACYHTVEWLGAGPHESYPDRLDGAFLGLYKHRIPELEVPYAVPQENGNRSGLRFMGLSGDQIPAGMPRSLVIIPDRPLNMGCSRYTPENRWAALHTPDLKDDSAGGYFLNLDCAQRGVGTATCGPDTREEYRVRPGLFTMRLYITGIQ